MKMRGEKEEDTRQKQGKKEGWVKPPPLVIRRSNWAVEAIFMDERSNVDCGHTSGSQK